MMSHAKPAAVIAIAVLLVQNFTATQSTLVKGLATFGAALGGLYVATKI